MSFQRRDVFEVWRNAKSFSNRITIVTNDILAKLGESFSDTTDKYKKLYFNVHLLSSKFKIRWDNACRNIKTFEKNNYKWLNEYVDLLEQTDESRVSHSFGRPLKSFSESSVIYKNSRV